MLLIIHAGLHKTASTFLQALLVRNADQLREADVWFAPDRGMFANHSTAWHACRGNPVGVREHVKLAMSRKSRVMILTSEDFEMAIFDHRFARLVEQTAYSEGAASIEWHFCLRDPGDYFASQYSQLSIHGFVDFAQMFVSVMRDGHFRVDNDARHYPTLWDHCFDYETHILAFARAIRGLVRVHDFRDSDPFPGHGIVDLAVGRRLSYMLPLGEAARNRRLPPVEVEARFRTFFEVAAEGLPASSRKFLGDRITIPTVVLSDCTAAVREK